MADRLLTMDSLFQGIGGLSFTLILGLFCECFLDKSVTAKPSIGYHEVGGGGKQLGVLERILFFACFLLDQYTAAAGWLAFKAAGKWASWQHVVKISDKDGDLDQNERLTLSSRLLGRFLNGTLYNILCASMGVLLVKFLSSHPYHVSNALPEWLWPVLLTLTVPAVVALTVLSMFFFKFCETQSPRNGSPT